MFWLVLFLFGSLSAQIVECGRFKEANSYVEKDTLLVLDIDDTLLIPVQMLGCDEWFSLRIKTHLGEGMDPRKALEKSLAEWEAVRHLTQMEIVEPGSVEVLQAWQERGIQVMGLTTQGLALATRTSLQLHEQGIDLKKTPPWAGDLYFENGSHGVLFRNGVLFTSGTHKGEALFTFLEQIGCQPKQIVFLNDKATHLAEVEAAAERRGVSFTGLRYGYSDSRKAAFRPEIAEIQFQYSSFARILSDAEALTRLEK